MNLDGGQYGAQLLDRRAPAQRHREPLVVVSPLPAGERRFGSRNALEVVLAPELIGVDSVAALNLAILLRSSGFDVPMFDAGGFDGQLEGHWKLRPVVALELLDREGEDPPNFGEVKARVLVLPSVQTQGPQTRAIVQGGVLEDSCSLQRVAARRHRCHRRDDSGSWKGVYGSDGYNVINDTVSYPGYAQVAPSGQPSYTWLAGTTATRFPSISIWRTGRRIDRFLCVGLGQQQSSCDDRDPR
jgi:hypothetical protein